MIRAVTYMLLGMLLPALITNEIVWRVTHDKQDAFVAGFVVYILAFTIFVLREWRRE